MTPEQLDEIEKLARDPKSAAFHDLMARQTILLVKALREAWEISKVRREEAFDWTSAYFEAQRERDEARASAEKPRVLEWGPDEGDMTWDAAMKLAASKGEGWRLPTVAELVAQFDYDKGGPAEGFRHGWYWSSSPGASGHAWFVRFDDGGVYSYDRRNESGVRCVRWAGNTSTDMSDERMSEEQILATIRDAQAQKDEAIRQRDEAREALEAMVLNCRYGCNRDSNCGVCAIALKALPNGRHVQSEDK